MELLIAPLRYEFVVNGMIAAIFVGTLCGLIGVYVVLRGMSYIGHGLSHAAFGGAVVGYIMNIDFYIGAGIWGFLSALMIDAIVKKRKVKADVAIGIVTTAGFAVGVALISRARGFTKNLEAALFGNILGVTKDDIIVIGSVTVITSIIIFLLYKQILFTTFDEETARVFGIRTGWIDTLFSLVLAASIIVSMQVIGVTMIAAAIIVPAATARLLTDNFNRMVILSVLIGSITAVSGMYLSFYINAPSGATIVLFGAGIFLLTMLYKSIKKAFILHEHPHRHGDITHQHEHGFEMVHRHEHEKE